jgi:hypothetical protein
MTNAEAVAEARENVATNKLVENCVVKRLLAEIEILQRCSSNSAAVIAGLDKEKRELTAQLQSQIRLASWHDKAANDLLALIQRGLASGHIRSNPFMDTGDENATEWPVIELATEVARVREVIATKS